MPGLPDVAAVVRQLTAIGIALPDGNIRVDGYGDTPELSAALIELIRSGRKRAGTGLLWAYEHDGEAIARTGDIEIVVGFDLRPVLVTRITRASIVPFDQVTAAYAAVEGEGDGSLDHWRRAHWSFFSRECARIGRSPEPDMPVVCSEFEVIAVVPLTPSPSSTCRA